MTAAVTGLVGQVEIDLVPVIRLGAAGISIVCDCGRHGRPLPHAIYPRDRRFGGECHRTLCTVAAGCASLATALVVATATATATAAARSQQWQQAHGRET